MDSLPPKCSNKNGNIIFSHPPQQHYSIPPPHAHSLINKNRDNTLLLNTEIKIPDRTSPESGFTVASESVPNINNSKSIIDNSLITDHEIKFTKTEGCTPSTCICVFFAILLISIGASSGIYFGLRSYEGTLLKDRVFKGQFTVTRGDSYNPKYEKRSSEEFKETAKLYKDRLDLLYSDSSLSKTFKRSEILALEKAPKMGSDDLIVHFNLIFSPLSRPSLSPVDVDMVLGEEVSSLRKKAMKNITIDRNSIDIQERKSEGLRRGLFYSSTSSFPASAQFMENTNPWQSRTHFPGILEGLSTEATPPPRRCNKIFLPFCSILPYNYTSYPNIVGHWNITSLEEDFVMFRQIVDAECYPLAREFICRLVQPECEDDTMIWPCRDFCDDFYQSCSEWIPKKLATKIKCNKFPSLNASISDNLDEPDEDDDEDAIVSRSYGFLTGKTKRKKGRKCRPKPGCINELKMRSRSHHICDSVVDCLDGSDEFTCDYCVNSHRIDVQQGDINAFFCGNGQCIGSHRRCDSVVDCNNGLDEKGCFYLSSSPSNSLIDTSSNPVNGKHNSYESQGILYSLYAGQQRKVCASNFLNNSIPLIRKSSALQSMASKACKQLGFRDALKVEAKSDSSQSHLYVQVNSIQEDIISFQETSCSSRQIVHIICIHLECGQNPGFTPPEKRITPDNIRSTGMFKANDNNNDDGNGKDGDYGLYHAFDGDWPWQAFISKNSDYACDAILVDNEWVLTTSNCFDDPNLATPSGQPKWTITLGSVRIISKSPLYSEERTITALMNSSAHDQLNLTIVRLAKPVNSSDYIRPVCLPEQQEDLKKLSNADCYSTFWDIKKDRLLFARATIVDSSDCINLNDDFSDRKRDNHWCVKLSRSESENRLDKINGCPGCGLPGRPLYCSFSHTTTSTATAKWFLMGIESSSNAADRNHRQRSAKTTYWYSKVSRATEWVHKVVNSFKEPDRYYFNSSYIIR